jgi:hypothetical protein
VDLVERREMFLSLLGRVEEYLIVLCFVAATSTRATHHHFFLFCG